MKKYFAFLSVFALLFSLFPNVSFAAVDEKELTEFLEEVSSERGIEFSKVDLEDYVMEYFEEDLAFFENVTELRDSLGAVIKSDYSNLETIYEDYELDQESLFSLLEENGESIDNYIFVDDLYFDVSFFLDVEEMPEMPEIGDMFAEFDLTEDELNAMMEHLVALEDKLSDPAMEERLMDLADRMMAFEDFESVDDLTDAQISEFLSISQELLNIFELQPKFFLTNGTDTQPLSLKELLYLKDMKKGYKLKIEFYDLKGKFILDMLFTAEMIGAKIIQETGKDIKEVPKVVEKIEKVKSSPKHKTVKGAKLPKTASDYGTNMMLGLGIALVGGFMFRRLKIQ
ncbi:processed acidic surface protein [Fictibacillus nanhaiensis]|uniref:Processed acidic surface protein n=1 Tax=Fictibacillus nanhaiensis TaxID=742169 RepID=A0ABS2ZS69_9BACL|nr:processed acidic surface protein [Fictibacillus nanhaiensis]